MYLDRDLRDLADLLNVPDFVRIMRATALRIGNLFNQSEMGRDSQMSQPQVHRYLNLLEISYQFVRLNAFVSNRSSRLIKASKAYWTDTALAMSVAGETEPRGAHLENMVLHDLLVWQGAEAPGAQVMYWRTAGGREVDFVVEHGRRHLPIEVKTSTTLNARDAAALTHFLADYHDSAAGALILYNGTRTFWLADRILATPWWKVI